MVNLDFNQSERSSFLSSLWETLESFYSNSGALRVAPQLDRKTIIAWIESNANSSKLPIHKSKEVIEGLKQFAVHTGHPDYFGLFNPRSSFAGIVADLITATMNPQMAAWSHAPLAIEIENYLVRELAVRFGYDGENADGVFCGGGAEANLTAVICAVNKYVEGYKEGGLMGVSKRPVIYCSEHTHHSIARAARIVGLGHKSVVSIKTGSDLRLSFEDLSLQIEKDRENGRHPIMVVSTAGTTGPGTIDELTQIGKISKAQDIWYHVDGAYGAAIILHDNYKNYLAGIEHSDSITFDIHKWLAVPMGASVFITSNSNVLGDSFGMHADYMPRDSQGMKVVDPYMHSIQWSRRFIGLKLYMTILFYGWDGIADLIGNHIQLGEEFRSAIATSGWQILNESPLPVICFVDQQNSSDKNNSHEIVTYILQSGKAWLSTYPIDGVDTIRVCINNHITTSANIHSLVRLLDEARSKIG